MAATVCPRSPKGLSSATASAKFKPLPHQVQQTLPISREAMKSDTEILNPAEPVRLLAACPVYQPSPLRRLNWGDRHIWVKDETDRMGLGAFKALGGVYAVARLIENAFGKQIPAAEFRSDEVRRLAKGITFVCASAGNHGMAVAAGASLFGAKARIHLAAPVPEEFARRLRAKGAEVVRSGQDYEESVAIAIKDASVNDATHLSDSSWPGYAEIPRLVMEGYTVIAEEMRQTFEAEGNWPSHVYLQAGVGGFAAAIAYMIRKNWTVQPKIIVVEPDAAPCLSQSVAQNRVVTVEGPVSNMGRLDCKAPSMLAFEILRKTADRFFSVSDETASDAVLTAADLGFTTTPSGAAGLAALLSEADEKAEPLVIFTEGAVTGG